MTVCIAALLAAVLCAVPVQAQDKAKSAAYKLASEPHGAVREAREQIAPGKQPTPKGK
jgi:hypothetical protein